MASPAAHPAIHADESIRAKNTDQCSSLQT